jgi:hypothetical protein
MFDLKSYTVDRLRSAIAATRRAEQRFRAEGNLRDASTAEQTALDLEVELESRRELVR